MELTDKSQPARDLKTGQQTVEIAAEKRLKIKTSPDGEEIFNEKVPTGKKWSVYIYLEIRETDA